LEIRKEQSRNTIRIETLRKELTMFKNLIGALILSSMLSSQLTTAAYSYNAKRLELEADECVTKIWAGIHLERNHIRDHLQFLADKDPLQEKYTIQMRDFADFYEKTLSKVADSKFQQFAEDCKIVYEESDLTTTKAAVLMLLERVAEKYAKSLLKLEQAKAMNNQSIRKEQSHTDTIMKAFLNADGNITVE